MNAIVIAIEKIVGFFFYILLCSFCKSVYQNPVAGPAGAAYFIDLIETTQTVPGSWEWGDGTQLNYDKWGNGQPDQQLSTVTILRQDLKFGDRHPSDDMFNFICEK